jgi:hypothetical protein
VELIAWSGCPSHPAAAALLERVLRDIGAELPITTRFVETETAAVAERFVGSPSFRVEGQDLFPPTADEVFALTCRIYRKADGRYSPLPDKDELRERLRRALG